MKKIRSRKPKFKVGDLVACYAGPESYKIIVGWVRSVYKNELNYNMYYVTWSDMDEYDKSRIVAPISEKQVEMCYKLLKKAEKLNIWAGKKIL